jgi:hypothetical protein
VPQEARLGRRLQDPCGGFAEVFEQRRLTKRSREIVKVEVRRISLLRTPVNKGYTNGRGC